VAPPVPLPLPPSTTAAVVEGGAATTTADAVTSPAGQAVPSIPVAAPRAASVPALRTGVVQTASGLTTTVEVPVLVSGKLQYWLGARIEPARWQALMAESDGVSKQTQLGVYDSAGRIVWQGARESAASETMPAHLKRLVDGVPQGMQRVTYKPGDGTAEPLTVAGVRQDDAYLSWRRSPSTGWGAMVVAPAGALDAAESKAIHASLAACALSLAVGLLLAVFVARRVSEPLQRLARVGPEAAPDSIEVREIATLRDALRAAHRQRETARRNLQAKVDEFEALFGSIPVGLAIARDPHCEIVTSNPSLDAMLGIDPALGIRNNSGIDLQGSSDEVHAYPGPLSRLSGVKFFTGSHELAEVDYPLRRAAERGLESHGEEMRIQHPDGRHVDVLAYATALNGHDGRSRGAISAFVDVTARRQAQDQLSDAERRLRASQELVELAQEAGHVGFFDFVCAGRVLSWTGGMARLLNLPPISGSGQGNGSDSVCDGDWTQFMPMDADAVTTIVTASIARRDRLTTYEFRVPDADGSIRWLSVRGVLSYAPDGSLLRLIGVAVDVTDEKAVERERADFTLREQAGRLEAEAANHAKDEFLAMLGHELRNPLGAISAAVELLNRGTAYADAQGQDSARRIIARQVRHLTGLTNDLLDTARVSAGKIALSQVNIDLAGLVKRAVGALRMAGLFDQHRLTLHLESVWADTDELRFDQMVNNLLTNAVKYTPAGGLIDVTLEAHEEDAVLRVTDTGMGMPADLVPKVFDLFTQGERSLDRRLGGLGIGLTLVQRLAELHGGHASAYSAGLGKGSEFTISLPRTDLDTEAVGAMTLPAALGEDSPRRVVIVEDNEDARAAMETLLEMAGHRVSSAGDGEAGLATILQMNPDLALIDIGLPKRDGYSVARALRGAGFTGRLVALTGYGTPEDALRAREAGFDEHQVKPLDWAALERLLD
ncbi:MAG: chemotaxis protein methyltransferase CheR, partial [Rhizobacter sp.]|nr:chemotaxis protein methyltransferase CheR [Rhizobacter sp.]